MDKSPYYTANDNYVSDATVPILKSPPSYPMSQTVIIQQPNQQQKFGGRQWSSGICSFCDDMESCLCTLFCGSCYLSRLYSKYGECCCTTCCVPHPVLALRIQHRNRHKITGSMLNDCCTSTLCMSCATCQMKRDMDYVIASKGSLAM